MQGGSKQKLLSHHRCLFPDQEHAHTHTRGLSNNGASLRVIVVVLAQRLGASRGRIDGMQSGRTDVLRRRVYLFPCFRKKPVVEVVDSALFPQKAKSV